MIKLTKRQKEIAEIITKCGVTHQELADKLGCSVNTVHVHFQKMRKSVEQQTGEKLKSNAHLIVALIRNKFETK